MNQHYRLSVVLDPHGYEYAFSQGVLLGSSSSLFSSEASRGPGWLTPAMDQVPVSCTSILCSSSLEVTKLLNTSSILFLLRVLSLKSAHASYMGVESELPNYFFLSFFFKRRFTSAETKESNNSKVEAKNLFETFPVSLPLGENC